MFTLSTEYDEEDEMEEQDSLPPLEGMDSGEEDEVDAPSPPLQHNPHQGKHVHRTHTQPPAKSRIASEAPLPPSDRNAVAATKKAVPKTATDPGDDFFGFGSSLTVKGESN